MNPAESLEIINEMIRAAKNKLADDGFYIIFWGWLVFSASLINYISIQCHSNYGYYAWPILMPLGGIISGIYSYKQKKKKQVKTYVETYLSYSWLAFGIALGLSLLCMQENGMKVTYFFLMILYGLATFISGGILNFKPLIIGSLFSFAFALLSVFLGENEQYLCVSAALLCSYIIPGHLLQSKFKSQVNV